MGKDVIGEGRHRASHDLGPASPIAQQRISTVRIAKTDAFVDVPELPTYLRQGTCPTASTSSSP